MRNVRTRRRKKCPGYGVASVRHSHGPRHHCSIAQWASGWKSQIFGEIGEKYQDLAKLGYFLSNSQSWSGSVCLGEDQLSPTQLIPEHFPSPHSSVTSQHLGTRNGPWDKEACMDCKEFFPFKLQNVFHFETTEPLKEYKTFCRMHCFFLQPGGQFLLS